MRSKPAVADLMSAMVSSVGVSIATCEEGGEGVTSGAAGVVGEWKGLQDDGAWPVLGYKYWGWGSTSVSPMMMILCPSLVRTAPALPSRPCRPRHMTDNRLDP